MSDSCNPMDCSPPGSSVHAILQARILEWVAISFSRVTSQTRNWTQVSLIAKRCFTNWAMWEAFTLKLHLTSYIKSAWCLVYYSKCCMKSGSTKLIEKNGFSKKFKNLVIMQRKTLPLFKINVGFLVIIHFRSNTNFMVIYIFIYKILLES